MADQMQGRLELAEVLDVADPEALSRVRIRFLSRGPAADDPGNSEGQDATAWALVAVPFAGDGMGAFFIPDVGDRVVVSCLNGDARYPVVLGSIWDGSRASPESLPGSEVDRWSLTGKAGSRIAITEENGTAVIDVETPGGARVRLDDGAGEISATIGGSSLTMSSSGVSISTTTFEVSASSVSISAPTVSVDAVTSSFSGIVTSDLNQTNTTVSSTYTPGAGGIW
ncbi:phage baseplate assembly protein V [Poseidonocella sp. HB161398]|uniref:phage baseplate assembly protein V n=1 Tax=Poseidonocella sp. HB161398 TaxID=2320855 RepID=UPI00110978FF|nr:phage baseplate assembly protein V [Poseidonocella sp. HB161398]